MNPIVVQARTAPKASACVNAMSSHMYLELAKTHVNLLAEHIDNTQSSTRKAFNDIEYQYNDSMNNPVSICQNIYFRMLVPTQLVNTTTSCPSRTERRG